MNPSTSNSGMELPPPYEQLPPAPTKPPEAGQIEQGHPAVPEIAASVNAVSQAIPPATIPLPMPHSSSTISSKTSKSDDNQTGPRVIQDKDLIEKEWVNKAKAIVERTGEDPYKQSEELTVLKADYMKKQFNKTVKLNK
jgi:hypothetical protein